MGPCASKGDKKPDSKPTTSYNNNAGSSDQKEAVGVNMPVGPNVFVGLKKGNISSVYQIGDVLGEGAFGKVNLVTHKQTGMQRAMKSIKKKSILKEDEEKLFAEMNILKDLDHPNIVKLYELYQDENNYYLITEFCPGGELFERIKSMTSFSEKMAADYMKQILSAVVYCHDNKIVHRDLKPENLLLDSKKSNSNIKVIDFGTSRKFENGKKMSKRLGTPYYIAPEVLDQNYDEKCDVWSCGVILYILLCGYPPFSGANESEILSKVKSGKFTFDPEDWDRISDEAKSLIKKMLTMDFKQRLSAKEALNDPWIQKNSSQNPLSSKCLNNLSNFHAKNKFKQAIMTFIATQVVSQQEKDELMKSFKSLDKDSDGKITRQELIEGYMKILNEDREAAEQEVNKIMESVDTNQTGVVDFSEFIVAAMNKEKLLSAKRIEQTFRAFDRDGNGKIELNELKEILGGAEFDDDSYKKILEAHDTNGDGVITIDEFTSLLTGLKSDTK